MSENEKKKLLEIKDLKIYYPIKGKRDAEGKPAYVKAVDGVTFDVYENETFGLVGESGCGKSTTGRTVVRLNKPTAGSVTFEGHDLFAKMNRQQNMDLTQKIQIIYQDPYSSLDPRFTVGRCIEEPLIVHHMGNKEERRARVLQLMHDVGLREEVYTRYPHEFSGGQRQRIGVARALALDPKLVVCDEPVSALDVSIQAQILNLMRELQRKYQLTYIFISHNLSVVKHICDRIAVMYLGNIVEIAPKKNCSTTRCIRTRRRCWGRFRFPTRTSPRCRTCWKAMYRVPSTRRRAAASTRGATAAARNAPRRSRS